VQALIRCKAATGLQKLHGAVASTLLPGASGGHRLAKLVCWRSRGQPPGQGVIVKILVPLKRVPDPAQKPKLKDGAIDTSGATWIVNTFDEYAVETALRLLENGEDQKRQGGEIVVVTVGPEDAAKELRQTLRIGADRGIHVVASDHELDAPLVARILAKVVETEKPDLVLMGKQAVDGDANQVGQMLAGKLNYPQATFAATIEVSADKKSLLVGREVDDGVEFKRVPLPAVVTVDLRIIGATAVKNGITPPSFSYQVSDGARLPSLKNIMAGNKKPVAASKLADLGISTSVGMREVAVTLPQARAAGQIVADVPTLVKKLVEEAKVL
jgi:electron transfer flavoprotein beta subunit